MKTYVLAGGCFWCLDAVYRRLKGVSRVVSGYSGGYVEYPTYPQVALGTTGHAESVRVTYDESIIPTDVILDIFFLIHDPTSLNQQGADVGTQYRSAVFYADTSQETEVDAALQRAKSSWGNNIVTEISTLVEFYPAEPEHQDYFSNNPGNGYCSIVITPKIIKARAAYSQWFLAE